MPLREFWNSVRAAARFISPKPIVDSPRLDAAAIEQGLRGATRWLTPALGAGFDAADFPFLSGDDRTKLAGLVEGLRKVAEQVPPIAPATAEQIEQALPPFRDIIRMLEFDRYGDAEAYRLGKQIERVLERHRPPELVELRFNTGTDSAGDPAIWIWGFLSDVQEEAFLDRAGSVLPLLDWASRTVAPDLFPYISFQSVADQAELAEAQ
jgi:hypothetical protein